MESFPLRQIRAVYDERTVRVYQAYSKIIADSAIANGTFKSPPFKMERMTWIKPSFLWMMYRSGWGQKDKEQCRILAIDISISGFEWALKNSCLSHKPDHMSELQWQKLKSETPVRIQWDPERDLHLNPLNHRAIQIGLSNEAVFYYTQDWIKKITDITHDALSIKLLIDSGDLDEAKRLLPLESYYSLSKDISDHIGATD